MKPFFKFSSNSEAHASEFTRTYWRNATLLFIMVSVLWTNKNGIKKHPLKG